MKIPTKQKPSKPTPKTKPNHKANSKPSHPKTKRSNKNNNLDHRDSYEKNDPHGHEQQINSDDIISEPELQQNNNGRNLDTNGFYLDEDYRTPEQVKLQIAKKLIQKTKNSISKKFGNTGTQSNNLLNEDDKDKPRKIQHDNFFVVQEKQQNFGRSNKISSTRQQQQQLLAQELKNQYLKSKNKLFIDRQSQFKNMTISEPVSYKGHTKCITGVQYTDDKIFSVSKDCSIINWDRETGKKDFITLGRQNGKVDHQGPILCMSYHKMYQMIATAGQDGKIKLWDTRTNTLIDTLKGHRNTVNGIKFGMNSNNLCTVSTDRTMKQWDCQQRGIIQTYYGHNSQVLDIDCLNQVDFISSGNDHQNIIWKTQKQTQVIFEGHDYAIDRVRSINQQKFITGCQDGSLYLWSQRKKKPIYKHPNAHNSWILSLDSLKQSNIFISGSCDNIISLWSINPNLHSFTKLHNIQSKGIITDLKINQKQIISTCCDQHRLGRWLTHRVRNQILVYRFGVLG